MTRQAPALLRMNLTVSEDGLKAAVMHLAKIRGWRIVHIRPAKVGDKWMTPYEGDSGLPDLIMARAGRVLLAELKSHTGRATPAQKAWLAAAGENGRLWGPAQWDQIVADLQ